MAFQKVFDLKEATLEYQSNGVATFQLYTDMPGGTLAARLGAGVTLPSTSNTRKTITIPLDNIQGTEYYPLITPGGSTQIILLAGKIWLRPIGVYLDGTLGEIWQTQPIAVGA
jgi:hypothetical protein